MTLAFDDYILSIAYCTLYFFPNEQICYMIFFTREDMTAWIIRKAMKTALVKKLKKRQR